MHFRAVAYCLFVLLTGWGSLTLFSAEPPAPIELSSEQIVKLVDGLTETDPEKYRLNHEAVWNALYRANDPLPLSKLLRDRLGEYKHQPNLYFFGGQTNEFLAQIAREMFRTTRHTQTNECSGAAGYLSILSQYREAADAKMILDEIKHHASYYAALKYDPWQACAHMNGAFGVLVNAILDMENVTWIAQMLSFYEDLDIQRKYVMRARLMLANEPTKQLIKEALTKVPFKNINSFIQTQQVLACNLGEVPRDIQYLLLFIPELELQSVSEAKETVTYHFRMPTDSDGLNPSKSDLVINVSTYPTPETANLDFISSNKTRIDLARYQEPLQNGVLHKWERYGHMWAAQFKQYRLDIYPTAPIDLKKTNAAFDQIYRSLTF